ncbi:hypothetical protein JVT61DRAFT_1819 [Boletus reticuloceps]|uniref:Uncharacterized protein n=1 Tax=Boletus reticuloceps TaxID=495285 RepID=A0A8I2YQV7_9AGAM|nr:hypothetical protein JVT61DRAFT_1819 [Boletus reticuloceps]
MSAVYTPADGQRPPERSRHRRAQSDPEHSYVNPPYIVRWPMPVPGRTPTPYPHSPSHNSSAELIVDPHSGYHLARHPTSNPPNARAPPPSPVSPRSPSPRPGHQRNASRQGSIRVTQVSGSLIRDVHQPPRSVLNVASVVAAPHPHQVTWGQAPDSVIPGQSQSPPVLSQSAGIQRQGSHHAVHQNTNEVHPLHHSSTHRHHPHDHPSPSTTHHAVHHRTRPRTRPPTAASHRYATSITQPVYGHGSSTTSNASRTSLNANSGVASQRHPRVPSPPPASSISHHHRTGSTHGPLESHLHRSQSHTHAPSISGSIAPPHSMHRLEKMPLAADDIHRHTDRPPLPANYDGQTQTPYVNMLLALDDISPIFNFLSAFFTWILLAGFVLLPGTFASLRNEPAGSAQSFILTVVNHISL